MLAQIVSPPTGGMTTPAQQPAQVVGLFGVHRVEQPVALHAGKLGEQVRGVVGFHLLEEAGDALGVELGDEPDLLGLGELLEDVGEPFVVHRLGELPAAVEQGQAHQLRHEHGVAGHEPTLRHRGCAQGRPGAGRCTSR